MDNYGYGFVNPFAALASQYQPPAAAQPKKHEIVRVNGRNGVDAFQMGPNDEALLLDVSAPVVWLKTTDGAGYPTITGYSTAAQRESRPRQCWPFITTFTKNISRTRRRLKTIKRCIGICDFFRRERDKAAHANWTESTSLHVLQNSRRGAFAPRLVYAGLLLIRRLICFG